MTGSFLKIGSGDRTLVKQIHCGKKRGDAQLSSTYFFGQFVPNKAPKNPTRTY